MSAIDFCLVIAHITVGLETKPPRHKERQVPAKIFIISYQDQQLEDMYGYVFT